MPENEGEQEPVVVRDRRRIDPETGELKHSAEAGAPQHGGGRHAAAEPGGDEAESPVEEDAQAAADVPAEEADATQVAELQRQLEERTADVQRLSAEYANFRKRTERERETLVAGAKANLAGELLTVLDDLERAESHGDLTGPFKAVADRLTSILTTAGLEAFGVEGEEFDPAVHEAVQHATSSEVSGPTVTTVLRRGYRFDDRVLRPAMVAVTDYEPAGSAGASQDEVATDDAGDNAERASADS